MVVHPAPGNYDDTLVNALLYNLNSLSSINGVIRPGIVHRLDKDTSGLLVVAKTDEAHVGLSRQIAEKSAERIYRAVVDGRIAEDKITVNKPIARNLKDRKKMAIRADGKKAVTHISVLKRYKNYTYIECKLETGRTHQIRVHLKSLHHPVIGDYVYGGSDKFNLNGQLLHAYKLSFVHPITNERMTFTAELPEYFKDTLENLEKGEQL